MLVLLDLLGKSALLVWQLLVMHFTFKHSSQKKYLLRIDSDLVLKVPIHAQVMSLHVLADVSPKRKRIFERCPSVESYPSILQFVSYKLATHSKVVV